MATASVSLGVKQIAKLHVPALLQTTIDRLPRMDDEGLKALGDNARRILSADDQAKLAEAIEAEQASRKAAALEAKAAVAKKVARTAGSGPLADRIERAFRAMPLTPLEVQRLVVLYEQPGATEAELAEHVGDEAPAAFGLAVARICKDRSSYLPAPEKMPKRREPLWSGLLCVLTPQKDAAGKDTNVWRLRPETVLAAQRLGLFPQTETVVADMVADTVAVETVAA